MASRDLQALVGATYPPGPAFEVTADHVAEFSAATGADPGASGDSGDAVPPTYPIVPAFRAMLGFLAEADIDLSTVVHGEQRFSYDRPVRIGDRLQVELIVRSVRVIGGNAIIGTESTVTDADARRVCTGTATLVHRGSDD